MFVEFIGDNVAKMVVIVRDVCGISLLTCFSDSIAPAPTTFLHCGPACGGGGGREMAVLLQKITAKDF